MLRLVADENFNSDIIRGLRRRYSKLDFVRVQDTEVAGAIDPDILEWAAREGRIVVTHDIRTIPAFAWERIASGRGMPGVIAVHETLPIGAAIDDLLLLITCSHDGEWDNRIEYLPL